MISRRIAFAVAALLVGWIHLARAADRAADANADTPAAQLIGDAVTEYDAGRYDEARALFRLAHQKAPTARTLRGIGMASFELRDYVEAARTLAGALREERRPLTEEQRRQVEGLLARADTFVGRFSPQVRPASAELLVDGQVAPREPDGSLLLGFGHHRITARCASCSPTEKVFEVEVAGGERKEIEIVFAPPAEPGLGAPNLSLTDAARSPAERSDADASAGAEGAARWWWAGAAVVGAVGATVGGIWWADRGGELDTCRMAGDRCKNESTVADQRDVAIGVTVGLGAAAIASGIVAALVWHRHDVVSSPRVACLGGKGTVSCAIRF
jgi:hypothetical protein